MSKKISTYDRAVRDFFAFKQQAKVEREKDRPYFTELTLAFLKRKGLLVEDNGTSQLNVGVGWQVMGKVGTRAGRYVVPLKDDPPSES